MIVDTLWVHLLDTIINCNGMKIGDVYVDWRKSGWYDSLTLTSISKLVAPGTIRSEPKTLYLELSDSNTFLGQSSDHSSSLISSICADCADAEAAASSLAAD